MPSVDLKSQRDGFHQGWASLVGASTATQAVDDSAGSSHDSDTTYFALGNPTATGRIVSFRMFDMAEHGVPTSIAIKFSVKKDIGAPELFIGFYKGGIVVDHADSYLPTGSYNPIQTRTFATNPFNASPWADGDLLGLEPCVRMADFTFASCRVTLLAATLTYNFARNSIQSPDPTVSMGG